MTGTAASRAGARPVLVGLLVFVLALGLRLAYIAQIRANPFFASPVMDAQVFDRQAVEIAGGDLRGDRTFYQAPLYPYLLGAVYALFGHDYLAARLVQALLGSLNCLLIFLLGRMIFSPGVGAAAGIIAAGYGPFLFWDAELLRPVLITCLGLLLLLALLRAAERPTAARWGLAGMILGLAAITQENILLFGPVALGWLAWPRRGITAGRRIILPGLLFCLAAAAVILPVTVRNRLVGGDWVLISEQGGLNFYIGNNPGYDAATALQPGADWEALASRPSREAGLWKPSQQSRWFYRQAFGFMRRDPLAWAGLLLKKLVIFWNACEVTPNNYIEFYRRRSPLLALLLSLRGPVLIPFGLVAPLALLGMWLFARRGRREALTALFLLAFAAAVVLYHVRSRYRLPAVPALILFAAAALGWLAGRLRQREWGKLLPAVGVLLLAGIVVNGDWYGVRASPTMPLHYNLGLAYLDRGRLAEAEGELLQAAAELPADANARNSLGIAYERMGRLDEARRALSEAVRLAPDYRVSRSNLGHLLGRLGRYREAEAELRQAVTLDPSYHPARNNLGMVLYEQGHLAEAESEFRAALRLKPNYPTARYNLGLVLLAGRRYDEAGGEFARAVRLDPADSDARRALEHVRGLLKEGPPAPLR